VFRSIFILSALLRNLWRELRHNYPFRPPIFPRPLARPAGAGRLETLRPTAPSSPATSCWRQRKWNFFHPVSQKSLPAGGRTSSGDQWQMNRRGQNTHGTDVARRRIVSSGLNCRARSVTQASVVIGNSPRETIMAIGKSTHGRNVGGRIFPLKWFRWWVAAAARPGHRPARAVAP